MPLSAPRLLVTWFVVPTKIIFLTPSADWLLCIIPAFLTGLGSHTGLGFLLYSSLILLHSQL